MFCSINLQDFSFKHFQFANVEPHKFTHKSALDDIESDMDDKSIKSDRNMTDDVYKRFKFDRELPDLPIVGMKDHILNMIEKNTVVVLEGATGCGKTTQVCLK